jgi:hypothetical protein
VYWPVFYKEVDRDGAVVAHREADLAIVIGQRRHERGGWCRQGRGGPSRPKSGWVMMRGEQNGLEEDRECAD